MMKSLNNIVMEQAAFTRNSGFHIDRDGISVAITDGEETIHFQEHEADEFINKANELAQESDVSVEDAMMALAKPYVECL